jgi:chemotaxis regulatin CheY-phosphate phosphatase CheZ
MLEGLDRMEGRDRLEERVIDKDAQCAHRALKVIQAPLDGQAHLESQGIQAKKANQEWLATQDGQA